MPGIVLILIVAAAIAALSACTSTDMKRAAYESAYRKECIERTGTQECDPEHETYDEYTRKREQATQPAP